MEYKYLRDSCDVFVGITHLGFEDDVKLAEDFPEFDLILGGHSHTTVKNPVEYNGVLVMQAGSGLKNVSKITVKLVKGNVVSKKAETISVVNYPDQDSTLVKDVERYNDNKELNRVIGVALNDIDGSDELGSLMADGITHLDEITVAFQNAGGIRIDKLPKGNITIKDMFKLDPFGNEIILLSMNGREIKSLIEESFNREKLIDLQVSGLSYKVFTGAEGKASSIKLFLPDGSEADDNSVFAVGLSSYIVSSYNFSHTDAGKTLYITTAQALINFISEKKEIDYKGVQRAFVEPAR
jgi:2',3'-cyclic-nucleotide 2'-phosphodiesterase (5'-nucleotidase family)